jgi:hypothetical protein
MNVDMEELEEVKQELADLKDSDEEAMLGGAKEQS